MWFQQRKSSDFTLRGNNWLLFSLLGISILQAWIYMNNNNDDWKLRSLVRRFNRWRELQWFRIHRSRCWCRYNPSFNVPASHKYPFIQRVWYHNNGVKLALCTHIPCKRLHSNVQATLWLTSYLSLDSTFRELCSVAYGRGYFLDWISAYHPNYIYVRIKFFYLPDMHMLIQQLERVQLFFASRVYLCRTHIYSAGSDYWYGFLVQSK